MALAAFAALDRSPGPAEAAGTPHADNPVQPRIIVNLGASSSTTSTAGSAPSVSATTTSTATRALSTTLTTTSAAPALDTSTTALAPGSSSTTSPSGATGPTGVSGPTGPTSGKGGPSSSTGPLPLAGTPRPQTTTGVRVRPAEKRPSSKGGSAASGTSGQTAPPPTLSEAANPLNGVLPAGFSLLPGPGTNLPDFFIQSYHVPVFLLPIYQAAASAYGIPWQVLAAINEVETDYGNDLNVSSAGAEGWMQFMPPEWTIYGVDAAGDGVADPYNPADAIFAAARYLKAAGGQHDIKTAIFAYNHSAAYVESVLLRAQLLGGLPSTMVDALSDLADGHFPIQPHDRPSYLPGGSPASTANGVAPALSTAGPSTALPAAPTLQPTVSGDPTSTTIYADPNAAVVAVQSGIVSKIGYSRRLGRYVELRDAYGNTYTYGNLASVESLYPIPNPPSPASAPHPSDASPVPGAPAPNAPATAGDHLPSSAGTGPTGPTGPTGASGATGATPPGSAATPTPTPNAATEALAGSFDLRAAPRTLTSVLDAAIAVPARHASKRHARPRPAPRPAASTNMSEYYTADFGLKPDQLQLVPLRTGSQVLAGTILGRLGAGTAAARPHLSFELRPAGAHAQPIDPRPFLDAWSQLETTLLHRRFGLQPLVGPDSLAASAGRVVLLSKSDLQRLVLADPHIQLGACARADVAAGRVDRRVLATLEYLVVSGLDPSVANVRCGGQGLASAADATVGGSATSLDITGINGVPILGHQGPGSIAETTIERLLELQGSMYPTQIVSLKSFPGAENTIALPDHTDRIEVVFSATNPAATAATAAAASLGFALSPSRWNELVARMLAIPQPAISPKKSGASVPDPAAVLHAASTAPVPQTASVSSETSPTTQTVPVASVTQTAATPIAHRTLRYAPGILTSVMRASTARAVFEVAGRVPASAGASLSTHSLAPRHARAAARHATTAAKRRRS